MTGDRFRIRRAEENDVDIVYKLIVALGYPGIATDDFKHSYSEVLANHQSIILLAESAEGQVLGVLTLSHRPQLRLAGTILCLDEFAVSEDRRGMGVGRALLQEAKNTAVELQAKRIELHTNRARESYARSFYVKNGFTEANSALLRLDL